jgi:hypothetical protein
MVMLEAAEETGVGDSGPPPPEASDFGRPESFQAYRGRRPGAPSRVPEVCRPQQFSEPVSSPQ